MGEDKALKPFLGRPLIQRVLERVSPLATELIVITNRPEAYAFLDTPLVEDVMPGRGALGGLYTALTRATQPLVAVIACDMPFVSQELITAERDILIEFGVDVVIPQTEGGMEPFHAIYRRDTCLPAVERALAGGHWRVDSWFSDVKIHYIPPSELRRYDPEQIVFLNLNTPADFTQAEKLATRKLDK
jgi:molybdenum cofactor guanylyltransferase